MKITKKEIKKICIERKYHNKVYEKGYNQAVMNIKSLLLGTLDIK